MLLAPADRQFLNDVVQYHSPAPLALPVGIDGGAALDQAPRHQHGTVTVHRFLLGTHQAERRLGGGLDHAIAEANPGSEVLITQDKIEAASKAAS